LLEVKTWATKWERAIDKIDEWVTWWLVNDKIDKESFALQTNYKHFQGGYGILQLGNVYTCHGFLQRMHSLKKWILEYFSQVY
jgi:hypothetical protein